MNLISDCTFKAVRSIENVNSWYEQEIARGEEEMEVEAEWLPPDKEVVGFVDRLVFILIHLSQNDSKNAGCTSLADNHWWRTFVEGYSLAGQLLAYSRYRLREYTFSLSDYCVIMITST